MLVSVLAALLTILAGLGGHDAQRNGGSEPIWAAQRDGGSEPIWAAHRNGGSEPIWAAQHRR